MQVSIQFEEKLRIRANRTGRTTNEKRKALTMKCAKDGIFILERDVVEVDGLIAIEILNDYVALLVGAATWCGA